jgi:uncharacterized sporulation protein YeaH/YhbH (DUF444 family)
MIESSSPPTSGTSTRSTSATATTGAARDTERCVKLLNDVLLPKANVFCYGQVRSAYGSGQFKKDLDRAFDGDPRVITSDIADRDGILGSIRSFLGTGR